MSIETELFKLIQTMNPYIVDTNTQNMEFGHLPQPGGTAPASNATSANFQVEIDNYKGVWSFRGSDQQIKRSLRVTYPILDQNQQPTGLYATEHLLIGYAGGNGP